MAIPFLLIANGFGQQSAKLDGAPIFASSCAGCHGADGRGGEHAPNIATLPEVQNLQDADLLRILKNGLLENGMPAFSSMGEEKLNALLGYLRILQGRSALVDLKGDPHQGELIFKGKGECSSCHMVNGVGGFLGSDLSLYGVNTAPEEMRAVITNPDKNLPTQKKAITVVMRNGYTFTGMLKSDNNFALTVQGTDGAFHFFQKQQIERIEFGTHSLMPVNYASILTTGELDDLLSYLVRTGNEAVKGGAVKSQNDDDDD
jgi:putative heme-binding domain-containing protein